jgi:hypothetical protein
VTSFRASVRIHLSTIRHSSFVIPPLTAHHPMSTPETTAPTPSRRARRGKIACLPRAIRDQLNRRIDDGEQAKSILPWLNALPEVQSVLEAQFESRPISEQILSEWRQGGFHDWLDRLDLLAYTHDLMEHAEAMQESAGDASLIDHFCSLAAVEVIKLVRAVKAPASVIHPKDRPSIILAATSALTKLRNAETAAANNRLKHFRIEAQKQQHQDRMNRAALDAIHKAQTRQQNRNMTAELALVESALKDLEKSNATLGAQICDPHSLLGSFPLQANQT